MEKEILDWIVKTIGKGAAKLISVDENNCFLVKNSILVRFMFILKHRYNFSQLVDMTAVDNLLLKNNLDGDSLEPGGRFSVFYIVRNYSQNQLIQICTSIGEKTILNSIVKIFPPSDWYEREIHEMFGIQFYERPNLQNLLLPEEIKNFPLRKDYKNEHN